jgi:hypothetical protein
MVIVLSASRTRNMLLYRHRYLAKEFGLQEAANRWFH